MKKILTFALMIMVFCCSFLLNGCTFSQETSVLRVAMSPDFPPMEFVDTSKSGQEKFAGFDVMLAKYIADSMDKKLEIVPLEFTACQDALEKGEVDLAISGFARSSEREVRFNISDTYDPGQEEKGHIIITTKNCKGKFKNVEDFANCKVGAQEKSIQKDLCNKELPDTTEIVAFKDLNTAKSKLLNGEIDGLAMAEGNAIVIMESEENLVRTGFSFNKNNAEALNVILIQKGNEKLTHEVNKILAEASAAGYYAKWYSSAKELSGKENAKAITYDEHGNMIEVQ